MTQAYSQEGGKMRTSKTGSMFRTVLNTQGSAADDGDALTYDLSVVQTNAADSSVAQPATEDLAAPAGIAQESIAASGYGEVKVYGYDAAALVSGDSDVAVGDTLIAANGVDNLVVGTVGTNDAFMFGVATEANTVATAAATGMFIRGII